MRTGRTRLQFVILTCMTIVTANCKPHEDNAISKLTGEIIALQIVITPTRGTTKNEVDGVFGPPTEYTGPKWKGCPHDDYPLFIYQLLPPRGKEEFRAILLVSVCDGKVWNVYIDQMCLTKGRSGYTNERIKKEIEREYTQALTELKEIKEKFGKNLDHASWNKH